MEGSAGVPPDVSPLTSGIVLTNLSGGGGRRRVGCAGGDASAPLSPGDRAGLLGSRGGKDGLALAAWGRAGIDRLGSRGGLAILAVLAALESSFSLAMAASLSRLVGGSGGRLASSSGGGNLRPSFPLWLVVWFRDRADILEA